MSASRTYTGKVLRLMHKDNPRRRRPLVSGRIQPDLRPQHYRFETYEDARNPYRNYDRVAFELDDGGNPINIRKIDLMDI